MKATLTTSYAGNGYALALDDGRVLGLVLDDASKAYAALRGAWGESADPVRSTVELVDGGAVVHSAAVRIVPDDGGEAFAALGRCVASASDSTPTPQTVAVEVLEGTAEDDMAERDEATATVRASTPDLADRLVSEGTIRDVQECIDAIRGDPAAMDMVNQALSWGRWLSAPPRGKG